jgi:hypothetical protein
MQRTAVAVLFKANQGEPTHLPLEPTCPAAEPLCYAVTQRRAAVLATSRRAGPVKGRVPTLARRAVSSAGRAGDF